MEFVELKLCVCFAVKDFSNIENKKLDLRSLLKLDFALHIPRRVRGIVFTIKYLGTTHFRFQALENVLWMTGVGLLAQFLIDRVAGRQNEKMLVPLRLIQVIDAGSHQSGFTNAGSHMIAERRKIKFIGNLDLILILTILTGNCFDSSFICFAIIAVFGNSSKIRQSLFLGSTKAHGITDFLCSFRHLPYLTFKRALLQKILRDLFYFNVFGQIEIGLDFGSVNQQ